MIVSDLIKELKKFDPTKKVYFHYTIFNCIGHGPEEYCYCSSEDKIESVGTIDYYQNLNVVGGDKKHAGIVLS